MGIEWDERKRAANLAKHGLDFGDAEEVFAGPCLEKMDPREDYGEDRWLVLGSLRGRVVFLAYAERGANVRVISMRRATAEECKAYEQAIKDRLEPR
jgi:uncharacterized DUF497 family protein